MQAQIKTLLPSSVMVKISLTDSSQITLLLAALYMTLCQTHHTDVNILGDDKSVLLLHKKTFSPTRDAIISSLMHSNPANQQLPTAGIGTASKSPDQHKAHSQKLVAK